MIEARRVLIPHKGTASVLRYETTNLVEPGAGEVTIAVEAAGIAFADVMVRLGYYPGHKPPCVPGYDVAGRIVALGPGVENFAVGARVAAMLIVGGYASHVNAKAAWVVPAPESIDARSIVAASLNYTTALQMMTRSAGVVEGDLIVVHGAGGGVGTALLDLGRSFGMPMLATASPGKHAAIRASGAEPIDYRRADFVKIAKTRGGAQAVFDHVGGAHIVRSLRALRPSGTVVNYGAYGVFKDGKLSIPGALGSLFSRLQIDPLALFTDGKSLSTYSIGVERDYRNAAFRADFARVMTLLGEGKISPVIDSTYKLEDAAAAQQRLERAQAQGKIVLVP